LGESLRRVVEIAPQSGESGESVQRVLRGTYAAPAPVIARLKVIIEP
jgi:hypothetical protein